jgi:2',3'-cyclic-nucleotide 2'-phosphodiesterase
MKILYIGDVMGDVGLETVESVLPKLRKEKTVDLVIAQAENVSDGKGITPADFKRLRQAGVDFCTGGNHIFDREEIFPQLSDPAQPIIRPANYPIGTPGLGYKYAQTAQGQVLIVSLLGQVVGKDAGRQLDNPLLVVDEVLEAQKNVDKIATIINFHGDYSSEKVVIGQYLDGRATAVIGDHWHVPTADARILPDGTAHITDVGMVGILNSSLGVTSSVIIERWREGRRNRNLLETTGPRQFNAVLIETNNKGLANSIVSINLVIAD